MMHPQVVIAGFGGPERLHVQMRETRRPGPGEVLVRIEASSVTATDSVIRKGLYPVLKVTPPEVIGYDLVGRIEQLGQGVTGWNVGARVADIPQIGGNQRFILRPARELTPISDDLASAEAVCLVLSGMTAWQMLNHGAGVTRGQRILIQGGQARWARC